MDTFGVDAQGGIQNPRRARLLEATAVQLHVSAFALTHLHGAGRDLAQLGDVGHGVGAPQMENSGSSC